MWILLRSADGESKAAIFFDVTKVREAEGRRSGDIFLSRAKGLKLKVNIACNLECSKL